MKKRRNKQEIQNPSQVLHFGKMGFGDQLNAKVVKNKDFCSDKRN